jgi:hypothetical protein
MIGLFVLFTATLAAAVAKPDYLVARFLDVEIAS